MPVPEERVDRMVLLERLDAVAVVRLHQPARKNALSRRMREQLQESLLELQRDASVRAIVLTGSGDCFCAGGDISEMRRRTVMEARASFTLVGDIMRLLVKGAYPVVAAVEGSAFGAGLCLSAASDYVVAARNARFGAAFARMGLLPDFGGLWAVAQRTGVAKAREIFGLARTLDADQAERVGLVNETVAPGETYERALAVAREYVRLPPMANAFLRRAFAEFDGTLESALSSEIELATVLSASDDHAEAAAAFIEKREPVFRGR